MKLSGKKFAKHAAAFVATMAAKRRSAAGRLPGQRCNPCSPEDRSLVCGGALMRCDLDWRRCTLHQH